MRVFSYQFLSKADSTVEFRKMPARMPRRAIVRGYRDPETKKVRRKSVKSLQDYSDDVIIALKDVLGINLSRKYLPLVDIKKMLGATKKVAV
jgi:hypothetical protein